MFSLDGTVKYWLYNKPVDMRKSFNGLSGIVTNGMCADFRNGDVYIFMNAGRNMMKMLRREEGGLVLYAIRLDMGRMKPAAMASDGGRLHPESPTKTCSEWCGRPWTVRMSEG